MVRQWINNVWYMVLVNNFKSGNYFRILARNCLQRVHRKTVNAAIQIYYNKLIMLWQRQYKLCVPAPCYSSYDCWDTLMYLKWFTPVPLIFLPYAGQRGWCRRPLNIIPINIQESVSPAFFCLMKLIIYVSHPACPLLILAFWALRDPPPPYWPIGRLVPLWYIRSQGVLWISYCLHYPLASLHTCDLLI